MLLPIEGKKPVKGATAEPISSKRTKARRKAGEAPMRELQLIGKRIVIAAVLSGFAGGPEKAKVWWPTPPRRTGKPTVNRVLADWFLWRYSDLPKPR